MTNEAEIYDYELMDVPAKMPPEYYVIDLLRERGLEFEGVFAPEPKGTVHVDRDVFRASTKYRQVIK